MHNFVQVLLREWIHSFLCLAEESCQSGSQWLETHVGTTVHVVAHGDEHDSEDGVSDEEEHVDDEHGQNEYVGARDGRAAGDGGEGALRRIASSEGKLAVTRSPAV